MRRARLFGALGAAAALALGSPACKRKSAPAAAEHAASPLSSAQLAQNAQALQIELSRTHERLQAGRELGCQSVLSEPADLELCSAAVAAVAHAGALSAAAPSAQRTHELAEVSLALDRLLERVRFLSFGDLMRRRMEHDAGASAAPDARDRSHEHALALERSPLLVEAQTLTMLEKQTLRGLGAYLEYGSPAEREVALGEARRLIDVHPKFRALGHELKEASVLETDPTRKAALEALVERVTPPHRPTLAPAQPTGSK